MDYTRVKKSRELNGNELVVEGATAALNEREDKEQL